MKTYRKFRKDLLDESKTTYPTVNKIKVDMPLQELKDFIDTDEFWQGNKALERLFVLELYLNEVILSMDISRPVFLAKALYDGREWGYDGLSYEDIPKVANKYVDKVNNMMGRIDSMQGNDELKVVSKVKCLLTIYDVYKNILWGEGNANKDGVDMMNKLQDPIQYKVYADCLLMVGEAHFYNKDYDKAYTWLDDAANAYDATIVSLFDESIDEGLSMALYNRGWALYKLGRFEESLASYEKAIETEETSTDALWEESYRQSLRTLISVRMAWSKSEINH